MPAKRGPGCLRKRLRMQDLVNKCYEAVEQEHDDTVNVFDAYSLLHLAIHERESNRSDTPTREEKLIQKLRKLLKPTKD